MVCVELVCVSTSMATKLGISDLADVLAAIKEVTRPYQLGIQLTIDSSQLDTIERNHPGDIDRQKTEVVKYWLRNSSDASWTTLANAVERIGGHARLAERLKSKGIRSEEEKRSTSAIKVERKGTYARLLAELLRQSNIGDTTVLQEEMDSIDRSEEFLLDGCVFRIILLFGKMGHGKSTLGNRILGHDGCFKINDQQCPQTIQGSSMLRSASQLKDYIIKVYDHSGLFEGATSIDKLSSAVPEKLDLVIFVLKRGCDFDESEVEILKSVVSEWKISRISALVLTHCERLSEEERGEMIEQFKKDHPSIAELMGKGILAVGFPDSSHIHPGSPLSLKVEEDKKKLRQLIYSCNNAKFIPQFNHQGENRQRWWCSIL